jgi:hypothetical protein
MDIKQCLQTALSCGVFHYNWGRSGISLLLSDQSAQRTSAVKQQVQSLFRSRVIHAAAAELRCCKFALVPCSVLPTYFLTAKKGVDLHSQGCKIMYKAHECFEREIENEFLVGKIRVIKQFTFIVNHCFIMLHLAPLYALCFLASFPLLYFLPNLGTCDWCTTQAPSLLKIMIVNDLKLCSNICQFLFL